jgi:hypothetical protein
VTDFSFNRSYPRAHKLIWRKRHHPSPSVSIKLLAAVRHDARRHAFVACAAAPRW